MAYKDSKYPYPSSHSGGVKPLSIRGVYEDERYRISEEYNEEERMWNKQWYKDQILDHDEPRYVPELEKELYNPIRRFASKPFKYLEAKMTPVFGESLSGSFRFFLPKFLVFTAVTYWAYYHMKYNKRDWTRFGGVTFESSRPVAYPGDPDFPLKRERINPWDYEDLGFKARKVFQD